MTSIFESIKQHYSYVFEYGSRVQTLRDEIKKLKIKRNSLQRRVDDAARRRRDVYMEVTRWLCNADKAIGEAEQLVLQENEAVKKCFFGFCPDLKAHYRLSKKADKIILVTTQFPFDEREALVSYQPRIIEPSMHQSELFPSRVLVLNEIMDALKDRSLKMIGIYGVGGVGKTTLAKEVSIQARKSLLFVNVIMISVSRFPNYRRIHEEVAGFFGLEFDPEQVHVTASQLRERLKRSSLLIILDDVWQKLDLDAVGIPFGDEYRCKLLVTSRSKDVLSTEMGSQKDFLVDLVSAEESLVLFQTTAPEVKDARLHAIAIEISEKCSGLPILINLTSAQLKGKELNAWADMLKQLSAFKNEDLRERVRKIVESSFENLPGEELKSLFLLCASFQQSNIQIQQLLIHCMGLRLFGNITTIQQERSRLLSLIDQLNSECLLLDGDLDGHVKLHDMFRDAALSIASSTFQNFSVGERETRLRDFPNRDCTRISLQVCDIQDLPASLQCPKAELFQLSSDDLCLEIPDSLFEGLAELKAVGFTCVSFEARLPSSLGFLRNLDTLCLHGCRLDDISVIGCLTELKFLSFAGSEVVELPREIEALTHLKLLDLENCSKLRAIPANVISKLCLLEELYMRNTCVKWGNEGSVSLQELEKLSCLSSLEIEIINPKSIPKFSFVHNDLCRCKIIAGREKGCCGSYEASRMLKLKKVEASFVCEDAVKAFLRGIEDLYLDEVTGMGSVLDEIGEGFPQLRNLLIKNNCSIKHLMKSTEGCSYCAFPILESLHLHSLTNLEMLCHGLLQMGPFGELQILKVSDCGKLKSLFSFSSPRCLWQLQEMEVESCENLEAIVSEGGEDFEFTRLRSLKLKNLPHLKCFWNKQVGTEKTGLLFHDSITFPVLKSLEVEMCKSLKYLFTRSSVKWLPQLDTLEINDCESVEELIWHKESEVVEEEDIDKIVFHNLRYVSLKKLIHLKRFSCGLPIEFPALRFLSIKYCPAMLHNLDGKRFPRLMSLDIENGHGIQHTINLIDLNRLDSLCFDGSCLNVSHCDNLKNLFMNYYGKFSTQLLDMEVQSCRNLEAIVGKRSEDNILELTQLRSLKMVNLRHLLGFCKLKKGTGQAQLLFNKMVSFPNLMSLVVDKCDSLKYVFTASVVKCLVQLKKLEISNCRLVEAIMQSNQTKENEDDIVCAIMFRKLDSLSLHGLPNAKMFGYGNKFDFPLLRELSIECPAMANFVSKFSDTNKEDGDDEHLFNELVTFPNLETMVVKNMDTLRFLWHEEFVLDGLLSNLKSLDIANCSRLSVVFPANTFRRFLELETLHLSGCDGMDEIFQSEETEYGRRNMAEEFGLRDVQIANLASLKCVFPNTIAYSLLKLEQLEIHNCNYMQVIIKAGQGINSFEDTSLLPVEMLHKMEVCSNGQVLEFPQLCSLKLKNLPHLTGFCNQGERGIGMQVSLPGLKDLELCQCKNFKYIFATRMVNSFTKLRTLEVNDCELVEEILLLSGQFGEVESIEKIVFLKLESLSLEKLPKLKTFDFGYRVEFPSLKELSISGCPVLKNFVSRDTDNGSDECLFNEMVTFSNLERMKVCHNHVFKYLWNGQFSAGDSSLKLKSLTIEYCSKLSIVFPSSICRKFWALEALCLRCCSKVEEVYGCEGKQFEEVNTVAFHLQDLEIWNLPSLKCIWSKDQPGTSTFKYLQSVKVLFCQDLMFVFPESIALKLSRLLHLEIGNSHMEAIIASTGFKKSKIVVPQLATLQLENLYQMRNLCEGHYTLKFPELKELDIHGCNQEIDFLFQVGCLKSHGVIQVMKLGSKLSAHQKAKSLFFSKKKLICNLEELTLDNQGLKLILSVELGVEFSKLKKAALHYLEEESIPLLIGFLRRCSLEKLVVVESYLEELFFLDDEAAAGNDLRLQHLEVVSDDNLKHILKKDSQFNPVLEELLTLNVAFCESLVNVAPSSASFRNLTCLHVSVCFKMANLVTASTAKTMTNLMELKVSECYMMQEIVQHDEMHSSLITFNELKHLELYDLPMLNSFSSSKHNFSYPSLDLVSVEKCYAMKNFCSGNVSAPKLYEIHFEDKQHWKGNLNATIASQLESRVTNTSTLEKEIANSTEKML